MVLRMETGDSEGRGKVPRWWIHCLLFLALGINSLIYSQVAANSEIKPYLDFLKTQNMSAKEYVLSLFNKYDLVVVCERIHTEMTQYDLYLSIIQDPQFTKSVGNIFTEIGGSNLTPNLDAFLHSEGLSADSVNRALIRFQRNCSFYPLWDNTNYNYFLDGLYRLNSKLPKEEKVNLYPSDIPFQWSTVDEEKLKDLWEHMGNRDSIIASQIIEKLDSIRGSVKTRQKALVILNYRHAFNDKFRSNPSVKAENVGRFLFEHYGGKIANVYLNSISLGSARSDNDVRIACTADGKWDAAFKANGSDNVGFDFAGSPFGDANFDIWPYKNPFKFSEIFTGFVYYLPPQEWNIGVGVPGLVDSSFARELRNRYRLYAELPKFTRFSDEAAASLETLQQEHATRKTFKIDNLDSLQIQINKWLGR